MILVWSRIWTRVAVFIAYGDNDYTTANSIKTCLFINTISNSASTILTF